MSDISIKRKARTIFRPWDDSLSPTDPLSSPCSTTTSNQSTTPTCSSSTSSDITNTSATSQQSSPSDVIRTKRPSSALSVERLCAKGPITPLLKRYGKILLNSPHQSLLFFSHITTATSLHSDGYNQATTIHPSITSITM